MRIAYFTETLPPLTDGVVNTLCHLINTLDEERVDYRFFSPVRPDSRFHWNHRVHKIASLSLKPHFHYRIALPYFHGIHDELDAMRPDLIHVVTPSLLGLYGMNYAKKKNIPVVTSYHTHFVRYFPYYNLSPLKPLGWQYLEWFHNQCDCTYAPSRDTAEELRHRGFRNVEIWPRGIASDRFSPDFRSEALREQIGAKDKPILLFVGRLVREKDLDDLIEANLILKAWGYDFKQVFVGNGPMREELGKHLPDAFFAGYQHGQDLAAWYASSDLFVFPSTTETFGNVILEAFASCLPVIGVDRGGQTDLIREAVNGSITPAHDPEAFAGRIAELLDDPEKRKILGQNARETAGSYSWRRINETLIQSYQNLINLN